MTTTKGVELASAYISLGVSTEAAARDVKKFLSGLDGDASSAGKRMGASMSRSMDSSLGGHGSASSAKFMTGFQSDAERRGAAVGTRVGTVIGKSIGGAMKVGIGAASAGVAGAVTLLGYSLNKGFQRLESIDQAKFKLQALGNSAEDVNKIMESATQAVKGTAFSLDQAANAAASAVAAGVKPGEELTKYLTTIADTAAVAGTSFDEMASIFNKVQTNNKAFTDDLQMLADRGIPVFQYLRDEFGVTAEDFQKMVEDGKVGAADFGKALTDNLGGAAQKMGQSFSGSVDNMQAAIARVGAGFLTQMFGGDSANALAGPTEAVNTLTTKFDEFNGWISANGPDIKDFFVDAAGVAKSFGDAVGPPLKTGADLLREYPGLIQAAVIGFGAWKTISGVSSLIGSLQTINTLLKTTIPASAATSAASMAGMSAASGVGAGFGLGALATTIGGLAAGVGAIGYQFSQLPAFNNPTQNYPYTPSPSVTGNELNLNTPIGQNPLLDQARAQLGLGPGQTPKPLGPGIGTSQAAQQSGRLPAQNRQQQDLADLWGTSPSSQVAPAAASTSTAGVTGTQVDSIAAQFGLTKTSGSRPGDDGYHGSGQAGDYAGTVEQMQQFAAYMSKNFGSSLAEIIFDAPGWAGNVKNGSVTGAFGNVYTMDQAGYHGDHVHIAWANFASGGGVRGPGTSTSDSIPAYLSNNEHVLTAKDVAAMGGQAGVYAFRNALHRRDGGAIKLGQTIFPRDKNHRAGNTPGTIGLPDWSTPGQGWGSPPADWWLKPVDPDDVLFPEWWGQNPWGKHPLDKDRFRPFGFKDGGAVDPELLKKKLAQQQGAGAPKQPMPVMPTSGKMGNASGLKPQQGFTPEGMPVEVPTGSGRTEGYIPAGAGFTGKTGGGLLGGLVAMGGEAAKGAIQLAADLGKMAASAAASAGTFGAGAAAGPAAGSGIQLGADMAKRGVDYGVEMAGIGIGALSEQLFPFGAPRWLSDVDPTAFIPNMGGGPLALTAAESFAQGAGPGKLDPNTPQHGTAMGAPPGPVPPPGPPPAPGVNATPPPPPPPQKKPQDDPAEWLKSLGIFDTGGVLQPNSGAINLSNRPEYVMTQQQWKTMADSASENASVSGRGPVTYNVQGVDLNEALRELKKVERRNSGPTMRGKAGL